MMEILVFAGIPVLLLLLLMMLGATWNLEVEELDQERDARARRTGAHYNPAVCVRRIFSRDDEKYVEKLGSARLRQIYRAERTRVAVYWVRAIAEDVRQIMLEHRLAAATKQNLETRRELALILRYFEFRMLCSVLVFSIRVFGPHAPGNMAEHALQVSEGIGRALDETMADAKLRALGNAGEA